MAGESMTNAAPIWLDEPPKQQRAPEAYGVGVAPLPTILVDHVRLGRAVRINLADFDENVHVRCES